ncbi:MAG TPA: glycosyltransferase, partial [Bacteroidota bacterium]
MKIGVAHRSFEGTGGIEKANRALYNSIADKGHEVHFHAHEKRDHGKVVLHPVALFGGVNSLRTLTFALNASRQLRSGGYDVTHSHGEAIGADVITAHSCHSHGLKVMRAYGQEMTLRHRNIGV